MVKNHICFKADDNKWITSLRYNKLSEYLIVVQNWINEGEEYEDTIELSTSNNELIALRDYLNSLPLSKRN